jgi:hypothetical protein
LALEFSKSPEDKDIERSLGVNRLDPLFSLANVEFIHSISIGITIFFIKIKAFLNELII